MFKKFVMAAIIASSFVMAGQQSDARSLKFDIEIDTNQDLEVIDGGLRVQLNTIVIVRPPIEMVNGKIKIGSQVVTRDNRRGIIKGFNPSKKTLVVLDSYFGNREFFVDDVGVTNGCNGVLCAGDKAVTIKNRSVDVVGFFNNGDVIVLDSYFGIQTFSYLEVAPAFGCTRQFCAGDQAISPKNRNVEVVGFFADGNIAVRDSYFGLQAFHASELSLTKGLCGNIYIRRVSICQ